MGWNISIFRNWLKHSWSGWPCTCSKLHSTSDQKEFICTVGYTLSKAACAVCCLFAYALDSTVVMLFCGHCSVHFEELQYVLTAVDQLIDWIPKHGHISNCMWDKLHWLLMLRGIELGCFSWCTTAWSGVPRQFLGSCVYFSVIWTWPVFFFLQQPRWSGYIPFRNLKMYYGSFAVVDPTICNIRNTQHKLRVTSRPVFRQFENHSIQSWFVLQI